jgi:hypothetical protein
MFRLGFSKNNDVGTIFGCPQTNGMTNTPGGSGYEDRFPF